MDSAAGNTSERRIRVFAINESPIFLEALRRFFLVEPQIEQVGSSVWMPDDFQAVADTQPDVIIVDPVRRRASLPDLIAKCRAQVPGAGIVVLTLEPGAYPHDARLDIDVVTPDVAIASGADAFVAKENTAEDLLAAIRRCAKRT